MQEQKKVPAHSKILPDDGLKNTDAEQLNALLLMMMMMMMMMTVNPQLLHYDAVMMSPVHCTGRLASSQQ